MQLDLNPLQGPTASIRVLPQPDAVARLPHGTTELHEALHPIVRALMTRGREWKDQPRIRSEIEERPSHATCGHTGCAGAGGQLGARTVTSTSRVDPTEITNLVSGILAVLAPIAVIITGRHPRHLGCTTFI